MKKFNKIIAKILILCIICPVIVSLTDVLYVSAAPTDPLTSISGKDMFSTEMYTFREYSVWWDNIGGEGKHIDGFNDDGTFNISSGAGTYLTKDNKTNGGTTTEWENWNSLEVIRTEVGNALTGMQSSSYSNKYYFQQVLNNLYLEDSKLKVNPTITFDGTLEDKGFASGDNIVIQSVFVHAVDDKNDGSIIYCGVDYNKDSNCFVYYYVKVSALWKEKDDLCVWVGYSQKLYLFDDDINGTTSLRWFASANNVTDATTNDDRITETIATIVQGLSIDDGVNIFAWGMENSREQLYSNRLRRINSLFNVNVNGDTIGVNIRFSKLGLDMHSSNNSGLTKTENNCQLYEDDIQIGTSGIDWAFGSSAGLAEGSSGFSVENPNLSNNCKQKVANLCADLISGTIVAAGLKTFQSNLHSALYITDSRGVEIANSGCLGNAGTFTWELFASQEESLAEAAKKSWIEESITQVDLNARSNSSFDLMQAILKLHVRSLCGEAEPIKNGLITNCNWKGTDIRLSITNSGEAQKTHDTYDDDLIGMSDIWSDLTPYQKMILERAYTSKLESIEMSGFAWNFLIIDDPPSNVTPFSLENGTGEEVSFLQELVNSYEESDLVNSGFAITIARCCHVASRYVVIKGLFVNENSTEDDLYQVYNSSLDSFVQEQYMYRLDGYEENAQRGYLSYMPSDIGLITSADKFGYSCLGGNALDELASLLYNVEYAFHIMDSSVFGAENGLTYDDMISWFEGENGKAVMTWLQGTEGLSAYESSGQQPNFNNDEFSVNFFRSVIELHDMCEFLGIDGSDWSDCINNYLMLYDKYEKFFTLLRDNPVIYKRLGEGINSTNEPLGVFFSLEGKKMSDQWVKGFANSALFVPMETNVYDANSVTFMGDSNWISEFFYKYGFYRKALYINTDNSAIVNKFVSGTDTGRRVATLADLLNYDRDIILYVDDNFYNAKDINTVISQMDYTAVRGNDNAVDTATGLQKVENWIGGLIDLDTATILKTGAVTQYSQTLGTSVTKFTEYEEDKTSYNIYDVYLLSVDEIIGEKGTNSRNPVTSVLDYYEYSIKTPFGIVSAIYRSTDLYNECLRASVSDTAIFKSSKAICSTPGSTSSEWRSVYNYCMLANLEEQMKNDTASTLDLDGPIFCDIFGNIVTESGIVVIPAACNATLCGTTWNPYTVGWSEYYNNGERLKVDDLNADVIEWLTGKELKSGQSYDAPTNIKDANSPTNKSNAGGYFWISDGELVLRTTDLHSNNLTGTVQFDVLNKNSTVIKQLFWNDSYFNKGVNMYSHTLTNLVIEAMRGAPIEFIDYEYEGLSGNLNISKYGVYMAYKLEELVNNLISGTNGNSLGGNSVITMPNLAFVSGIEYIVLYVFKIMFAVLVVGLGISLYLDAVQHHLGIKSVLRFVGTCVITVVAITLVPDLVSWTYYGANKNLLAEESGRIMMLNYVKEYDGSEIGITSVTTPETNTVLYLKVEDVDVPWYEIIPDVLFGHTFSTVSELYQDSLKDDAMALNPMVEMKGDGLYVDVQNIFDSTAVQFTPVTNMLSSFRRSNRVQTRYISSEVPEKDADGNETGEMITVTVPVTVGKDSTSVVSYTLPYYVILDQLIASINEYNVSRDISAYSWSVGNNGNILTYDIVAPYLTSTEFLDEGFDILGLEHFLGITNPKELYNYAFDDNDVAMARYSRWYPDDVPAGIKQNRIDHIYEYARNYVINNQDILGKVPDEVFLKVMAMQIAIEFNKEFNVSQGNAIEIINIDTRDLMRFMVAPKGDIYKYYSYSFSRYVYEEAGTIGVVLSALLLVVYWLTSFLKPLAMIVILALLIINILGRKVLFRKESKCVEGYLIGCACLCACNYLYALMLKVSMSIADLGLGSATALICAIVVQIVYVASLIGITVVEMKDWRNSGFNEFRNISGHVISNLVKAQQFVVSRMISKTNSAYGNSADSRRYMSDDYDESSVDAMLDRDREREERGNYNPN